VSGRPTDAEQAAYTEVLQQIKYRMYTADHFLSDAGHNYLSGPDGFPYAAEMAALQLRKVLELVLLGSLITNKSALAQSEKALARKKPDEALKAVEKLNPNFWPHPVLQVPVKAGALYVLENVTDGLKRDEYGRAFGLVSEWVHARNPLAQPLDPVGGREKLRQLYWKLIPLLNHFVIGLVDRDAMLKCQMAAYPIGAPHTGPGEVEVVLLERAGPMAWTLPPTAG